MELNIELSGGQHDPDIFQKLISYKNKINFMLHNYFPPPKVHLHKLSYTK